ncbi:MAG: TonB-dependent receptor [Acidobacteriota bacterium]
MRKSILLALLLATLAWPQSDANKGQIVGTVYDPNQAVVPRATVKIRNLETGFARELATNGVGQYRAVLLDPGRYEVVAQSAGFAATTVSGLVLNVGSTVSADITLQVASTTTTVEVGESLVNIAPSASRVIDSTAIRDLPINGRRFQDFALALPTVQVEEKRNQLSFAGQKGINSNVMVDGADYNQPFFGGIRGGERSNFAFTVPQSAIQEFQMVVTGYTSEYGRSTGGVMNAITKSGTNTLHGDAFYQLRHKELGLKNPFKRQSVETQHQYGGAAGGPIRRDEMFWFAALERQEARTPRYVFFPRIVGVAEQTANAEALRHFRGLETPFDMTNDATALTARTDYQFTGGHRLTLRYNFSDSTGLNANGVGTSPDPTTNRALTNNGTEKDRTHTGGLQLTSILSAATVNDLRFTTTYEIRPRINNAVAPTVSSTIGTFGTVNYLPTTQDDKRMQIVDALSLMRGAHTFKLGVDYSRLTVWQSFGFNQFGSFSISGSDVGRHLDILSVGGAVANRFDDTSVTYNRAIGNLLAAYGAHQFALYGQDSWRVTPSLTLDFGVRWEAQYNPSAEANNSSLVAKVKGFSFPIGSVDPTVISDNVAQVMPRIGFAWTPTKRQRTVVRGHTGLFYAATPLLLMAGPMNNFRTPPGDVSIQLPRSGSTVYRDLLAVGVDLNKYTLDKLPILDVETVQRAVAGTGAAPDPLRGANLLTWAGDYENPRAFQVGLGADTEVFRNFVAGAQFNYVNTVHLQRNRDFNLPLPVIRSADKAQRPFYSLRSGGRRPVSDLGALWVRQTSARSMYRGMTLSSQYRAGRLQFGAFYTWSETFSDDDQERDASGFRYDNSFNLRPEYGYSDLDMRHQFTGYVVASLPLGIETSSRFRFTTGKPIDPRTGADTNEDLASNDRAYKAAGVPYQRNSFRNRGFRGIDLRALKNFPVTERAKLQFSAEMFNLFDLSNVVYSGTNLNYGLGIDPVTGNTVAPPATFMRLRLPSGDFDPINTQVGNPFQMQLGLRLIF